MQKIFKNFYQHKRILITGHTGFKGSWLTLWLIALGADIVGYSLIPPTKPSIFKVLNLAKRIVHLTADIRDEMKLKKAFREYKPEIVFHLAAQPLVRFSYRQPKLTYETNVMGMVNLLEAIRAVKSVKAVVAVTSDKCYKNKECGFAYKETDVMGGGDPYSSSKSCAELIIEAYRRSFFDPRDREIGLASARAGNVIGGGDWSVDRLIPDCIRALAGKRKINIRNPSHIRNWQYILEPLSGYLWLGALLYRNGHNYGGGWNFGSDKKGELKVTEVVRKVISFWGSGRYRIAQDLRFQETKQLKLNIHKAKACLDWMPVCSIDEALRKTVAWYKNYYQHRNNDMYSYTLGDIERYIAQAKAKKLVWATGR